MTTLADIERVLATLSAEQRAQLRTLVASKSAERVAAMIELAAPEPRKAAPVREARDLVGPWRPLLPRPEPYDPLGAWR